ncbi:MAG: hypothetical protein HW421_2227 [Ignavibacteria bacterium]|nr:hypothetical protein [Ignavibacteria bacterium]
MSFREVFNNDEWFKLQEAVFWMFFEIAGADGKVDKNEIMALRRICDNSKLLSNQLIVEILDSIGTQIIDSFSTKRFDSSEIRNGLKEISQILIGRIDSKEAVYFKKSLIAIGAYIANSSGSYLTSMISDSEEQTLHELSLFLKLRHKDLLTFPTIIEMLKHLDTNIKD